MYMYVLVYMYMYVLAYMYMYVLAYMYMYVLAYTAKNFLIQYSSLPKSSVTDVFSELNQNRSSIGAVSDQYTHICIRPV